MKRAIVAFVITFGLVTGGLVFFGFSENPLGTLQKPDAGVVNNTVQEWSGEETTIRTHYYINNTIEVGGTIDNLNYTVYWSETENGTYEKLGDGQKSGLEIPAGQNKTYHIDTVAKSGQAGGAYLTLETQGYMWVRIEATATLTGFGQSFSKDFTKKQRVDR